MWEEGDLAVVLGVIVVALLRCGLYGLVRLMFVGCDQAASGSAMDGYLEHDTTHFGEWRVNGGSCVVKQSGSGKCQAECEVQW